VSAPGSDIASLGTDGKPRRFSGTSAAAPFVTGTIALLWSEFPRAGAGQVKLALTHFGQRSHTIVPPVLDAWAAFQFMSRN
jgi:subtilisin family serine protease